MLPRNKMFEYEYHIIIIVGCMAVFLRALFKDVESNLSSEFFLYIYYDFVFRMGSFSEILISSVLTHPTQCF